MDDRIGEVRNLLDKTVQGILYANLTLHKLDYLSTIPMVYKCLTMNLSKAYSLNNKTKLISHKENRENRPEIPKPLEKESPNISLDLAPNCD